MLRLATFLLASVTVACLAETLVTIENDLMGKLTGEKGEVSFVFLCNTCVLFQVHPRVPFSISKRGCLFWHFCCNLHKNNHILSQKGCSRDRYRRRRRCQILLLGSTYQPPGMVTIIKLQYNARGSMSNIRRGKAGK